MPAKVVMYIRVLKNVTYPICNADPVGYYFDGARKGKTYQVYPDGEVTHLFPCHGPAFKADNTGEFVREIESYRQMSAAQIFASGDKDMIALFERQLVKFPGDRTSECIHVMRLGKKSPVPLDRQKFKGANRGYLTLAEVVGSGA